jgi:3-hydroxyisobutyrate dehydrogenase
MSSKTGKVGVIGLGNMGGGIARNLSKAGYQVHVYDIFDRALKPFRKKATICEPTEMASKCSVIFFVVHGSKEIEELLSGRNGMLSAVRRNLVLYDLTTSDPDNTKRLARKTARKNVTYMDAGMTGGAVGADKGTLSLMIGGDKKAYKRTRKYLTPFTEQLFHVGKSGAGHTLKLIFNMVVHTNFLAVCEAGHIAKKAGIDLNDMIDVFNAGNARSYISEQRFPNHILSGTWDGRSSVYNLHKDLGMAMTMVAKFGTTAKLGKNTHAYLKRAVKFGMSEKDFTRLYQIFGEIT